MDWWGNTMDMSKEEAEKKLLEEKTKLFHEKHRELTTLAYEIFGMTDVGPARVRAHYIYENIRIATRV